MDRKTARVERGDLREVSLRDCAHLRVLGHKIASTTTDVTSFALAHDDLISEAIIIDDEYNVKGSRWITRQSQT